MDNKVSLDAVQIALDFNHLKEVTGASDEMVIQMIYQILEERKATLAPIGRILDWPVQN